MHHMLMQLSQHFSTLSIAQDLVASQQKTLLAAERKAKVEEAVRGLTNTMSVRSLEHNYKFFHMVEDLLEVFAPNGVSMVATDLAAVSDILAAASFVFFEITRLSRREM